ncbi:MAG TPA: fasciclin domain-containing protein, partial [Propionibacteriaceae bacterium]|nr:fasciclin domain-containing protein [Propionibacteriaceae bacterium]
MNGNPGATKAASADIVDTGFGAGALTTLTAALTAAGLTETLKGPGPLTVFAPTNEAFGLLPSGAIDNLLQDPFGQLTETLKYHVVPGEVMAADLVNGQALMTVHGSELTVQVTGDQVTLVDAAGNSANVITGDVAASNGVIHIIDAVLLPTASPAAQEIAATPTQAGQDSQHRSDSSASTGTHFAPESVPRQRQTAKTSVRVLVGLNYVAMIAVNALANILPINGRNTGEISDSYENLFAPAGLTFSIWGVIYLLLGTHVLYQLGLFRGAELDDGPRLGGGARVGADEVSPRADLLQRVGVLFSVSSLVNVAWIFSWHYD